MQMNKPEYSAYPKEAEMLLEEGCQLRILGIEENVAVKNKHAHLKKFYNKKVMVIYVFMRE